MATGSPPPAAAIPAGWALFDPFVVTGGEDAAAGATAAACFTSDGHAIRVSLRLADPPAASYVEMRTDAELYGRNEPTLVAADGGLLLISVAVVVPADPPPLSTEDHNFFVYSTAAHPASSPSLLRLLPHPRDWDLYTGIVARRRDGDDEEEDEFVAAAFHTELIKQGAAESEEFDEVGKLTRFSSSTGRCEVLRLPIPFDPSKGLYKLTWATDKVFAFGDLMCCVDYHRGILLCDVFAASPELRFVPLPEIEVWDDTHDYCNGRRMPAEHRTVDVSRGGVMRFVDVSDGLFGRRRNPVGVAVTTWTLRTPEMAWEKDGVLQVGDLWNSHEFRRSPLPRWAPEFPAVCKHDPDVVQFALLDPKSRTRDAWVILVNTRQMELESYAPYTNQAKKGREDLDAAAGGAGGGCTCGNSDNKSSTCECDCEANWVVVAGCLFYDTPLIGSDLCM